VRAAGGLAPNLLDALDNVWLGRGGGHAGHSTALELACVCMQLPPQQRIDGRAVAVSQRWQGVGLHCLHHLQHTTAKGVLMPSHSQGLAAHLAHDLRHPRHARWNATLGNRKVHECCGCRTIGGQWIDVVTCSRGANASARSWKAVCVGSCSRAAACTVLWLLTPSAK
jgi:hypothetical protein